MPKARILVIDDQVDFRALAEDLLTAAGYAVRTTEGAEAALHLLERERFDVVLTELVMPGSTGGELVARIKESWPDPDIVVVTEIGDVRIAVDTMRRGATDYVLKPVDRTDLLRSLDAILQRRRLRHERGRLLAENLEYLGALSSYERALGFVATLALEPLADRIIEGLCFETGAQGGVLWLARPENSGRLALAAARGLVQPAQEAEELDLERLPPELEPLVRADGPQLQALSGEADEGAMGAALWVPLRHAGMLLGFARLTDKLAGARFDDGDRTVAARLAEPAAIAAANALRHRTLETRTFRDPVTKAYTWAYFEDVLRNEIEKASRFARSLSIVTLELDGLAALRSRMADSAFAHWLESLVARVGELLRASDLLAEHSENHYAVLLPETDALGAAILKRRIRDLVEPRNLLRALPDEAPARLRLAAASYPIDGTQVDALQRVAAARAAEDGRSLLAQLGVRGKPLTEALGTLAAQGRPLALHTLDRIFRFALDELDRRAGERGLFCVAPGGARQSVVREALGRLDPGATRTDVVLVSDLASEMLAGAPVTCVSPQRVGSTLPFLIYYAEGPAYALVVDPMASGPETRLFHSAERTLVEELAFQLQRDLGVPIGR